MYIYMYIKPQYFNEESKTIPFHDWENEMISSIDSCKVSAFSIKTKGLPPLQYLLFFKLYPEEETFLFLSLDT